MEAVLVAGCMARQLGQTSQFNDLARTCETRQGYDPPVRKGGLDL